jgi:hypothetical protein
MSAAMTSGKPASSEDHDLRLEFRANRVSGGRQDSHMSMRFAEKKMPDADIGVAAPGRSDTEHR